jgi:hypothetical protein
MHGSSGQNKAMAQNHQAVGNYMITKNWARIKSVGQSLRNRPVVWTVGVNRRVQVGSMTNKSFKTQSSGPGSTPRALQKCNLIHLS